MDLGLIKKGGSWYTFPMFDDAKAQGLENSCQLVKNIPNGYNTIYSKVKEMLGTSI